MDQACTGTTLAPGTRRGMAWRRKQPTVGLKGQTEMDSFIHAFIKINRASIMCSDGGCKG